MIVTILVLMIYLVYFLAHYAHPEDTAFGKSKLARIVIYTGYFFAYILILTVQFDIYLSNFGVSVGIIYYAL
jgi:hypothetical protein